MRAEYFNTCHRRISAGFKAIKPRGQPAFIEGEIIVGGAPDQFDRESVNVEAPLPNIGVWYRYSLSPKWAFRSRYDYLNADVGDFSGTMTNAALGLNYQMFENFGVGLNYNFFELNLGITKPDWRGQAKS